MQKDISFCLCPAIGQGGSMSKFLSQKNLKPSSPRFEDEWFPGRDDDDYDWDD